MRRVVHVHRDRRGWWRGYCPCCGAVIPGGGVRSWSLAFQLASDHVRWGHR